MAQLEAKPRAAESQAALVRAQLELREIDRAARSAKGAAA